MAEYKKNLITKGMSGQLGKQLVIRYESKTGKTYAQSFPVRDPNREPTDAQKIAQDKFRKATDYAKLHRDEAAYVDYVKAHPEIRSKHAAAVRDALKNPVFANAAHYVDGEVFNGINHADPATTSYEIVAKFNSITLDVMDVKVFQQDIDVSDDLTGIATDVTAIFFDVATKEAGEENEWRISLKGFAGLDPTTAVWLELSFRNRPMLPGEAKAINAGATPEVEKEELFIRTVGDAIDYLEKHV